MTATLAVVAAVPIIGSWPANSSRLAVTGRLRGAYRGRFFRSRRRNWRRGGHGGWRNYRGRSALFQAQHFLFRVGYDLVILVVIFKKIGYVQERVALQANIHESGLHSGQHARDAAFMNAAGERVFFFALIIKLDNLIIFEQRHSGFVACRRYH